MKTETCKLYSEYFCQISSKCIHTISSYTVSKLGRFLRHSVLCSYRLHFLFASSDTFTGWRKL